MPSWQNHTIVAAQPDVLAPVSRQLLQYATMPTTRAAARIPVLYVHNSGFIGGGNRMLLHLFDALRTSAFMPVAILPSSGPMKNELQRRAIPHIVLGLEQDLARGRLASATTMLHAAI